VVATKATIGEVASMVRMEVYQSGTFESWTTSSAILR
jgi:hypothetical protein